MMGAQAAKVSSVQVRRGCRALAIRLIVGFLGLMVVLSAAGFVREQVMRAGDAQRYPMPGMLVPVDGYNMHLHCVGTGSPTVVFIGGAGALSYQDAPIQQRVSATNRACIYDRAGYLWSDPRPEPRTAWQLMAELHALLTSASIEPPYVLIGSSNGGLYARAYAEQYPDAVAGLVMVDARLETTLGRGGWLPGSTLQIMGEIGVFRLFPGMICPPGVCDPQYGEEIATFRGYASNLTTYDREVIDGLDGSAKETRLINERLGVPGRLGDRPLVILQANQYGQPLEGLEPRIRAFVEDYRRHYTALSSNADYRLIDSGHGIAVEHPDVVTQAIADVITAARHRDQRGGT
jgi:pimeloyl-ACP methyl ester carboxylesterase